MIARSNIRVREAQSFAPHCRRDIKPLPEPLPEPLPKPLPEPLPLLWQQLSENAYRYEIVFRVGITDTWQPRTKLGSAPKLSSTTFQNSSGARATMLIRGYTRDRSSKAIPT
jgi:hypothetical protein